jgi:hypothetical protein
VPSNSLLSSQSFSGSDKTLNSLIGTGVSVFIPDERPSCSSSVGYGSATWLHLFSAINHLNKVKKADNRSICACILIGQCPLKIPFLCSCCCVGRFLCFFCCVASVSIFLARGLLLPSPFDYFFRPTQIL